MCRALRQFVSISICLVAVLSLAPQVSQAEFIFTTGQEGIDSRQPGEFVYYCTTELVPSIAPATPEPTTPEPAAPESPAPALTDIELDGSQDATTSGPVTEATGGFGSSPAVLGTADLRLSLAGISRSHTLLEDLALDSPPPSELLDPPRNRI